jgi:hypothetical protein
MRRFAFPTQLVSVVGVILLLGLVIAQPAGAFPALAQTEEPVPRPTATPAPYIQLEPSQGPAGGATLVVVTGGLWAPGPLTLFWDSVSGIILGQPSANVDGFFRFEFTTPTEGADAAAGIHIVIAGQGPRVAEASFELLPPTPTPTFTTGPSPTWTATHTPTPTNTPRTPTPTATATATFTPSPTLRPVTPMVTISPIPPTSRPPGQVATRTPRPTSTNTPRPGTPTYTLTPSVTPTASDTPGPGTPSATVRPSATPVEEISETGSGWGTVFLWGFVLAGLLVVFRLLRVRSLPG